MRIYSVSSRSCGRSAKADGEPLTSEQNKILQAQLRTQNELLNSLLRGGDTLMLELTKLKVANGQLEDALKEINEATHRYLFWTSDVSPIGFSAAGDRRDLRRLISWIPSANWAKPAR